MRVIQAFAILVGALFFALICITAGVLIEGRGQWPAPSSEPPIQWNPSTDTLTITRPDVMVCIPQAHDGQPSCRFAKWWTETVIR